MKSQFFPCLKIDYANNQDDFEVCLDSKFKSFLSKSFQNPIISSVKDILSLYSFFITFFYSLHKFPQTKLLSRILPQQERSLKIWAHIRCFLINLLYYPDVSKLMCVNWYTHSFACFNIRVNLV